MLGLPRTKREEIAYAMVVNVTNLVNVISGRIKFLRLSGQTLEVNFPVCCL